MMNTKSESHKIEKSKGKTDQSSALNRFAGFIIQNCLQDFINKEIEYFLSLDLPLLKYISHLTDEEKFEITRKSGERFLKSLEDNTYESVIEENFRRWKSDEIKFISREMISLEDIVLINSGQKMALLYFLPEFTKSVKEASEIATALEFIYQKTQQASIQTLKQLQLLEEEKRKETEEKYKTIFENASDMINIVTPEGKILYVNNAWRKTLGYTEEELKGESIYFFVCTKDREKFRSYRNEVIHTCKTGEVVSFSFLSKNNKEIIVEGGVSCKYRDGKPEYTQGIFRDVTRRVQNEEKLRFYTEQVLEREEKIKQLIQNAPDAIIVINEQSQINIWNPKAEEIFGWKAEEVLGLTLGETIIPIQYREGHERGMQRFLTTGEPHILNKTIEITALKKDGTEFYISLTISKADLPQGILFVSFVRDITEHRRQQQELEEKRMQLERSNLELEQYAWVTSHDLKEPLRKIMTFSNMLLSSPENKFNEEAEKKINKINDAAARMDKLIEAILLYSNISNTQQQFIKTDLNVILKEVLSDLEIRIANYQAKINAEPLPVIKGIPFQLRQLFQNLISNAIKYSKPNVIPVIDIGCKKSAHSFIISIKDNGIGFDKNYSEKIFQVFQRLVPRHKYEGTGIGLALCKKIVENHGGTISATSKENEGACFQIVLPV